jgi:hypothetical protein
VSNGSKGSEVTKGNTWRKGRNGSKVSSGSTWNNNSEGKKGNERVMRAKGVK